MSSDADQQSFMEEITSHPEYVKLTQIGFENEEERHITLRVFLDLSEMKGWYQVKLCPLDSIKRTVVTGYSRRTDELQAVLPSTLTSTFSMEQILSILSAVEESFHTSKVLLGFVDADSTIVYYSLTNGLVPPAPPAESQKAEKRRQKAKARRFNSQHLVSYPTSCETTAARDELDTNVEQMDTESSERQKCDLVQTSVNCDEKDASLSAAAINNSSVVGSEHLAETSDSTNG